MAAKESFSKRLKSLRGDTPIKDLAKRSGVSPTVIYKAEAGEDTVSWKTIEAAYGDLCTREGDYENLLTAWAITHSERPVSLYRAREAMSAVLNEEVDKTTKESATVLRQMEMMPASDQRKFAQLASHFRRSEPLRKMVELWLAATS